MLVFEESATFVGGTILKQKPTKKFSDFYSLFTRSRYRSLSWATL